MKIIAPSMLSSDFGRLIDEIELINKSNADWFHLDIMDGLFVPNISFGMPVVKTIRQLTKKPLDVHLMIVQPEKYITEYLDFNLFMSAPGQGAIAIETNAQNLEIKKIVSTINDTDSMICTTNERAFMKSMGGGCNYPIGAYSNIVENKIFLQGIVLSLDGKKSISYEVESLNLEENLALKLSKKFFDNDVSSLLTDIDNEIK